MLLRKDVLKWIRNLKSGEYRKGKSELVNPKGTRFCCLGVWADQHGCTWKEGLDWSNRPCVLIPIAKGKTSPPKKQGGDVLQRPLLFGLSFHMQKALVKLNDNNETWGPVIEYLKTKVLPKAK